MASPPVTVPLDQPLPAALTGTTHTWVTEYRRWPVFSPRWAWLRLRLAATAGGVFMALTLVSALGSGPDDAPWAGMLQLLVQIAVPVLAGPALGVAVRRRHWPPAAEWGALLLALLAVVGAMELFHGRVAEPMKQWVAERTGQIDETGQRRRITLSIGIVVSQPDPAGSAAPPSAVGPGDDPASAAVRSVFVAVITLWLAGGWALWGWHRERRGLARLARERELAEAQAARREAELRLSVLAAQVEPHFLFNTLAGVRGAIASDPARASRLVDRLVDYLRATIPRLRSGGEADATVGAQFAAARAYLALMAERIPRLSFDVDVPAELAAARCPPWMLISLVENAVKHGIEPKLGPARIEVRAEVDDARRLRLTVADDGVGFGGDTAGTGIGLANIREQLRQMYGERATLTLKARAGGGVLAALELPLETNAAAPGAGRP